MHNGRVRVTDPATAPVWAVLNPVARRHEAARSALERACADAGWPAPHILTTTPDDPGHGQARHAVASGARCVVVGGGDGTVREVAYALGGTGVELGILPLGTANLFAHNLGLRTRDLNRAVQRALHQPASPADLCWASWRVVEDAVVGPPTPEVPFLVMAGLGHDAAAVLATTPGVKRRLGWVSYLALGARRMLARPVSMRISVNNTPGRRLHTWTVLVANAGRLPGGIAVFPDAAVDDGVLDVLEVPLRTPRQWAGVAVAGLTRHRLEAEVLRYSRGRTVWAVPDEPTPLHLDGDVVGEVADLRVRVQPGGLLVRRAQVY